MVQLGTIDSSNPIQPPAVYRYEAFAKEITHPKQNTPIYVNYEVLEFSQELTTEEITNLQTQLGKILRKID